MTDFSLDVDDVLAGKKTSEEVVANSLMTPESRGAMDTLAGESTLNKVLSGAGSQFERMGRGAMMLPLQLAAPFSDQARQMLKEQTGKKLEADIVGRPLRKDPAGFAGSMLPGMAVPPAASFLGNAARYGALEFATDPADTLGERGLAALGAGAGAGAGHVLAGGLSKALQTPFGVRADPELSKVVDFARAKKVPIRGGDVTSPTSITRIAENISEHVPQSGEAFRITRQKDALQNLLFGNQKNLIAEGVKDVDNALNQANVSLWQPVYQAAATAPKGTMVRPLKLRASLMDLTNRFPDAINHVHDRVLRQQLETIAQSTPRNLRSLPFDQYRELQQAVGQVLGDAQRGAKSDVIPRAHVGAIRDAYAATKEDINRWGTHGGNMKAFKLYEGANKTFKDELLPWMKNDIVRKIKSGDYEQENEKFLRDILSPSNNTEVNLLLKYLAKTPGGEEAGLAAQLAKQTSRTSRRIHEGDPESVGYLGGVPWTSWLFGALTSPIAGAASTRPAQAMLMAPKETLRGSGPLGLVGRAARSAGALEGEQAEESLTQGLGY